MKRTLLIASTAILLSLSAPSLGFADSTTINQTGETDAGSLIGKKVVDASNQTVGKIDSVLVSQNGQVDAVVVDVSSWLESKKLISVPWTGLTTNSDGNIVSNLTKDEANQSVAYTYKKDTLRGHLFTDQNELYTPKASSTNEQADNAAKKSDAGLKNADGSLNASEIIGLKVRNPHNDNIGKISEVLLNSKGNASGVIVDVGGLLGMGTHPVRLAWNQLQLHENGSDDYAMTSMTEDQLKQLPVVKR